MDREDASDTTQNNAQMEALRKVIEELLMQSAETRQKGMAESDLLKRARAIAGHFLGVSARSRYEIQCRLEKADCPEDIVQAVIAELEAKGWLNDQQFAHDWVADRADRKRYGRRRLSAELNRKGIEKTVIEAAVGEIDSESEYRRALEAATPRWRLQPGEETDRETLQTEKRRVAGFLQRRGFSWDIITQVLGALTSNTD